MSYFTLKNGEKLYYEDRGAGDKTIVMLHGWSSSHEVFKPVIPEISKNARCIVYDHRGHGKSRKANREQVTLDTLSSDLHEIIQGLDLHDITLLGWSMGAATVMNYTALFGCGNIRQIILCDMTPRQLNDEEWKLGMYQGKYTREDTKNDEGRKFYDIYYKFAVHAMPKLGKVPEIMVRLPLKEKLAGCDEGVLRSLSRSMREKDLRKCVGEITVPVSYFYAVPGSLFSPELSEWYRENVRSPFRAVAFEKCTHMMLDDQPEKFQEEVIRTLSQPLPAQREG